MHLRPLVTGLTVGFMSLLLLQISALTQEPPANTDVKDGWVADRTPWGDPDLQGIWSSKTQTPLERPDNLADREFLTDDEVSTLEQQTRENPGRDERSERGTVADVEGAYNDIFSTFFGATVVETGRTSLIVDPPDGRVPHTAEAKARLDKQAARRRATSEVADGPEDRPSDRCTGWSLPCTSPLCAFSRIVQTPGAVTLYYESGHWGGAYRTIPLDERPHLPSHVRQWFGDSVGRWESDTLVVDTTNFSAQTSFQGSNEDMHLVERFTRVNSDLILYGATIEDPTTFSRPWTIEMTWSRPAEGQQLIFESACHEGNYALTSILAGARALETTR
jgi:hypothetical protein